MFQPASGIRFSRGARNVWSPRLNQAGIVAFLTDKTSLWQAWVHWNPTLRRSEPCIEGCGHCGTGAKPIAKVYAPVLLYQGYLVRLEKGFKPPQRVPQPTDRTLWHERTLEITSSIADLVELAQPGFGALVQRMGTKVNDPCSFARLDFPLKVPDDAAWDVRDSLMRAWSC